MAEAMIAFDLDDTSDLISRLSHARRTAGRTGGVRFIRVGRIDGTDVVLRIQATAEELGCQGDPRMRAQVSRRARASA